MVVALFHADRQMDGQRGRHEVAVSFFFFKYSARLPKLHIFQASSVHHPSTNSVHVDLNSVCAGNSGILHIILHKKVLFWKSTSES